MEKVEKQLNEYAVCICGNKLTEKTKIAFKSYFVVILSNKIYVRNLCRKNQCNIKTKIKFYHTLMMQTSDSFSKTLFPVIFSRLGVKK